VIAAVLFDIDGTLLVTGGAGAVAWQRAFLELYGVEANIEEHTHAGMTDPEIAEIVFREVIGRDGSGA
jgi:beta-phosphoglucomutase-like phosphatase (HAD superfamily)